MCKRKISVKQKNFPLRCHLKYLILFFLPIGLLIISCTTKEKGKTNIAEPKTVLKLSPSENNPRNSEGDFINLKDGRILFVYSRYTGDSSSDHAPAFLAGRYSDDGGKTWTREDEVIVANEGGMNVMSVSLLRLQNNDIALFYLRKNSTKDCIPMMRVSKDEARSWSEATPCITDKEGYFVLNNDRVIQLEDGRLLMAVALHNTPEGEWKSQGDLFSYYTDDNGKTWHSSAKVPNTTDIITQEPGLIEMKDGRIMMYIRASGGFQQLSFSSDRGETWSHIETSNIPSPVSPATIEKIPETNDWLLVWNNNDGSNPDIIGKRTPLTTAISKDEGKTWVSIKNINTDPDEWYCYIAIHFVDDEHILLSNCAGNRPAGTGLSVTDITLIDKSWLYK
jgi:Neuraminidase (sialidase)